MALRELDVLIANARLDKEELRRQPMKLEHIREVSEKLQHDDEAWEKLGTQLCVPDIDIQDIKDKCPYDLQKQTSALIALWEEQQGSKATYYSMARGLMLIGKTKTTEDLLRSFAESNSSRVSQRKFKRGSYHRYLFCVIPLLIAIASLLVCLIYLPSPPANLSRALKTLFEPSDIIVWQNINVSTPGHDLPDPLQQSIFIGREHDLSEVVTKVMNSHIVNINGPPGFGKSTLAIHAGHKMVKRGFSVRYINMEESFSLFPKHGSDMYVPSEQRASLVQLHDTLLRSSNDTDTEFIRELKEWSRQTKSSAILILDNCDTILLGSVRYYFIHLIKSLVHISRLQIHIIVVSQEKLILLDNFDWWTVKELNQSSSVLLLNKFAPDVGKIKLKKIAKLLQGCPLALKVVGRLLNLRGEQFTNELITSLDKQPIDVLDNVSDKREQFRVIMDFVISKLGLQNKCGYMISLFPHSFSKEAGIAIITSSIECLEIYERQSLLDEYILGHQHRYKMHRLIREYLKGRVNKTDRYLFKKGFINHYINFILNYTNKARLSDKDSHALKTERGNMNVFIKYLPTEASDKSKKAKPELLAVLAFLSFNKYVQIENFQWYFEPFLLQAIKVCQFLNPGLCTKFVLQSVNHFYHECDCESIEKYFQYIIYHYPCKDVFECEQIDWIFKKQNLSERLRSFLSVMRNDAQCLQGITTIISQQLLGQFTAYGIMMIVLLCFIAVIRLLPERFLHAIKQIFDYLVRNNTLVYFYRRIGVAILAFGCYITISDMITNYVKTFVTVIRLICFFTPILAIYASFSPLSIDPNVALNLIVIYMVFYMFNITKVFPTCY